MMRRGVEDRARSLLFFHMKFCSGTTPSSRASVGIWLDHRKLRATSDIEWWGTEVKVALSVDWLGSSDT